MKNKISLIALIITCLMLVFSWYIPGSIIGGAEEGLSFLNLQKTKDLYKYSWEETELGGPQAATMARFPFFTLLASLNRMGFSADLLQIITFLSLLITAAITIYFLTKEITPQEHIYPFIASLFYILNTFMFFNIWNRFLIAMFFFEALLPISVFFFFKILKRFNFLYLFLFLLSSLIFSPSFSLPSNVITLWIALSILLISYLIQNIKSSKLVIKGLSSFFIVFLCWIITNLWWLLPLNYQASEIYSQVFGTDVNIEVLRSISNQFPLPTTIILGYKNMLSTLQTVVGFIMLTTILLGFKKLQSRLWKNFLLILVLLSFFVLNGSNFPTGSFFEFIFEKIPQLQLFRNPYEKFGIVLVLAYSILFSLGIRNLSKFSRHLAIFIVFGVFLLFSPFWFGKVFGADKINFHVIVPSDYQTINNLLNDDKEEFRVLSLPLLTNAGSSYNWPSPYFGANPNFQLFDKPVLESSSLIKDQYNQYWKILRDGFYSGKIGQLLKFANIKYLLLHKDIASEYSQSEDPETAKSYLNNGLINDLNSSVQICPTINILKDYESRLFEICKIDSQNSNFSKVHFLNFDLISNVPGYIRIDIVDIDNQRLVFDGKNEDAYKISNEQLNRWKNYVLNLNTPSERYNGFSLSNIDHIEIFFTPFNNNPYVEIRRITLDQGRKVANDYWQMIKSTSNLELYRVTDKYYYPRIYTATNLTKIKNWESLISQETQSEAFYLEDQLIENINYDLILSKPQIDFKRLDATKYQVSIKNAQSPFWLIFSESFSPNWRIKSDQKEFGHFPVNGYANGYFINQTGTFNLELEYLVQSRIEKYRLVSIISFALIMFLPIAFVFLKKKSIKMPFKL